MLPSCCDSWLHRQDYEFEYHLGSPSRRKSGSSRLQASRFIRDPSQYFLLGFHDRRLEAEYLVHLASVSQNRLLAGYFMCIVFVFILPFLYTIIGVMPIRLSGKYGTKTEAIAVCALPVLSLLLFMAGFGVCCALLRLEQRKKLVFPVTEVVFLCFTAVMGCYFAWYTAGWQAIFGPSGWVFHLAFIEFPPFLSIFIMNLPFGLVTWIMSVAIMVFMVIIPLQMDFWRDDYTFKAISELVDRTPFYREICGDDPNRLEECDRNVLLKFTLPFCIMGVKAISIVVVAYFVDRANRAAFVNKRIVEVYEAHHQKQKRDHEELLESIFPKDVAQDLIDRQALESSGMAHTSFKHIITTLGRTVARIHTDVTILFTDIVGFTAMSQMCPPYEVMQFLHTLFVGFDNLIEIDSQLWKVETIGDAFMVASGLHVSDKEASERFLTVHNLSETASTASTTMPAISEGKSICFRLMFADTSIFSLCPARRHIGAEWGGP